MSTATQQNGSKSTAATAVTEARRVALPGPVKVRRRPALVVASVLLVAGGAVAAGWAYTSLSNTQSVLMVRQTVHRGQLVTADDVGTVQIGVDPALRPVPEADLSLVVGKHATLDLAAGSLLTQGSVADSSVPVKGQSVVGVNLPAGQMPALDLQPGDRVRIVTTPGANGDVPAGSTPQTVSAVVVSVQPRADTTSAMVVNVSVVSDRAAALAAQTATGKVALVLDSQGG